MTHFAISESTLLPPDGGIIYRETDLNRVIPEPLNTLTAAIFIAISLYWLLLLLTKEYGRYRFLSIASYILLVGSVGGFAYHGLRRYPVFIAMDWVPILLLCMMASAYFWLKIVTKWSIVLSLMSVLLLLQLFIRLYLERFGDLDWGVSISYGVMALMVIAPVLIYASRINYLHSKFVFWSAGCFAIALMCRELDKYELLATGTHFLWHILGAMATHLMFRYIYLIDTKNYQRFGENPQPL